MGRTDEKPTRKGASEHELEVLSNLHLTLFTDVALATDVSLSRDIATVNRRIGQEGISFLTKTLPAFGTVVLQSVEAGKFQRNPLFHTRGSRALPEFLHRFTEQIFDKKTGLILDNPCYVSLWAIRQLTTLLYKYNFDCTDEQTRRAMYEMIGVNDELPNLLLSDSSPNYKQDLLLKLAEAAIGEVLKGVNLFDIVPKHGPGSTNEGTIEQYQKYKFRSFDDLLGINFPQSLFTSASGRQSLEGACTAVAVWRPRMVIKATDLDPPARKLNAALRTSIVHAVPKDSRGPRIISAEAKELMWIQQGQMSCLVREIKRNKLTRGHVNFDDQTVNARLAVEGSLTGRWATLDLKQASDRVSSTLVGRLFPSEVFAALWATRSFYSKVAIPYPRNKKVDVTIRLRKFAPMGSANCFPVEALVFWGLAVAAVQVARTLTQSEAASLVYIYGDDIIVPADLAEDVITSLEGCGQIVNRSKSFWRGKFRESCGTDAFMGVNVTPTKVKSRMPRSRGDAERLTSWCAYANRFAKMGLRGTAEVMFGIIEQILGVLPKGPPDSGILCRESTEDIGNYLPKSKARPIPLIPLHRGATFTVLVKDKKVAKMPDYQGHLLTGWSLHTNSVKPGAEEWPEENAWLHWVSLKGDSPDSVRDTRSFTPRHKVTLKRVCRCIS